MESLTLRASPSTASPLLRLPGRRRAASFRVSASASSGTGEPDLSVTVNGLKMPNPFVIGSGPPGTNYTVMKRAFDEGWGGVIAKTVIPLTTSPLLITSSHESLLLTSCAVAVFRANFAACTDRI